MFPDYLSVSYDYGVIDIFFKYAWIVPLKHKKDVTVTEAFQKTLNESQRKPSKIWVKFIRNH